MRMIFLPLLLILQTLPQQARAERLTVVELFTSQGCSSCPPADAILAELASNDPALLPLGMHITYWDRLGWKDPYSLPAATQRQRDASARLALDYIYTPQLVVNGRHQAVGSDRAAVHQAIARARSDAGPTIDLMITPDPGGVRIKAGAGPGQGTLILVGFDRQHLTPVRAGENNGRTLTEVNVVRALAPGGPWTGKPMELVLPRPPGDRVAALLQGSDGQILAATTLP